MKMKNKMSCSGTFIFIGFGSIAKATLPLFLSQKTFPVREINVISPEAHDSQWFENQGVRLQSRKSVARRSQAPPLRHKKFHIFQKTGCQYSS
jgi:homospermidine synthase